MQPTRRWMFVERTLLLASPRVDNELEFVTMFVLSARYLAGLLASL